MTVRTVTVGDDLTIPTAVKVGDTSLPDRLQDTALNATYATPATVATALTPKLDKTEAASTYAKVTDDSDLAFRAVRSALDAGRSTAIQWTGDSTGDSDGSNPADLRTPSVFLQKLATAYPTHRAICRKWDDATQDFAAPVIVQAGPSGRRYAQFSARTMRNLQATPPQFTSGNLDLRVLVAPATWTPAASQSLVTRMRKGGVAGPYSNDLQFELRIKPTGLLGFRYSTDGAAWLTERESTVAVPGTADTFMWVRVTVEIIPGTSYTTKFYTSPADDGVTWTQLGTSVVASGGTVAVPFTASADSFFEIGGQGWQPVNNALIGKISAVQIRDGVNGPSMAPVLPELWERYPDSSTTFGGSPTIHLINSSRSGSAMTYHTDATRLPKANPDYGQSLVIFNDSHNEVGISGPVGWTTPYKAWVDAVTARLPLASVAVVLQNPHTSAWANEAAYGESHKKRLDELRILAGKNRWGLVDLFTAFTKDPRGLAALIQSDGLHPEQIGYALGGQTVARLAGIAA